MEDGVTEKHSPALQAWNPIQSRWGHRPSRTIHGFFCSAIPPNEDLFYAVQLLHSLFALAAKSTCFPASTTFDLVGGTKTKMARTETLLEPTTLRETLRVYNVYETGHDEMLERSINQSRHAPEESTTHSDPNWPSDWRRMPPYRASSRTHRVSDRAAGQDAVEGATVLMMFSGVWMMGVRKPAYTQCGGGTDCLFLKLGP